MEGNDARFEKFIDEVTTGLQADPELRLQVAAELADHLDETARQFDAEGESAEESAEHACRAFGSPIDIAGDLLEANRLRLRWRARLRLAVRAVLIPISLLVALLIGYSGLIRVLQIYSQMYTMDVDETTAAEVNFIQSLPSIPLSHIPTPENARFLKETAPANRAHFRDIWLAHRGKTDGRLYLGRYLVYSPLIEKPELIASDLQEAMRLDPQNALYPYQLALIHLNRGISEIPNSDPKLFYHYYTIADRKAFNRGIEDIRMALQKPMMTDYGAEDMEETPGCYAGTVLF